MDYGNTAYYPISLLALGRHRNGTFGTVGWAINFRLYPSGNFTHRARRKKLPAHEKITGAGSQLPACRVVDVEPFNGGLYCELWQEKCYRGVTNHFQRWQSMASVGASDLSRFQALRIAGTRGTTEGAENFGNLAPFRNGFILEKQTII